MKEFISKNQVCKLHPGQQVIGKWHRKSYKIVKQLGYGATGTVYLAHGVDGAVALKVGAESMAISSEVNVLQQLSKVQGQHLGPSFIDVDDIITSEGTYPFYVMEYLEGEPLIPFWQKHRPEWLGILMVQLLSDLDRLHRIGWIFGDLKPENLIVTGPPYRIRWMDVGGTTMKGRAIKEYTEFFDRGYWGLGSRKAEPSYDLYSVAMIMINSRYPSRFDKKPSSAPYKQLQKAIVNDTILKKYQSTIEGALQGKFSEAMAMRKSLVSQVGSSDSRREYKVTRRTQAPTKQRKKKKKQPAKKSSAIFETFLVGSFLLLVYILYWFGQMM
ncbi:serine/threonine protein kinase [Texcoconibacillus texcoconensis]|uniref:Serine/threonine-protein kinase n=1 Tax=Texcoconibacillus texcoconensis TaxID=1095777 RepID=A0A840QTP5_9BACI|nr:protein kinase family protein [Texcoconibacillus texcoconensis]MBB5174892.1 serine/threonine-protein kinase [Texcoconibacillus texcoconensis]